MQKITDWLLKHFNEEVYVHIKTDAVTIEFLSNIEDFHTYGTSITIEHDNDTISFNPSGAEVSIEYGSGTEENLVIDYSGIRLELMAGDEFAD